MSMALLEPFKKTWVDSIAYVRERFPLALYCALAIYLSLPQFPRVENEILHWVRLCVATLVFLFAYRLLDDLLSRGEDALVYPGRVLCVTPLCWHFVGVFVVSLVGYLWLASAAHHMPYVALALLAGLPLLHATRVRSVVRDFWVSQKLSVYVFAVCLEVDENLWKALACAGAVAAAHGWHKYWSDQKTKRFAFARGVRGIAFRVLPYFGFLASAPLLMIDRS